jgi:hypothetical protein
MVVIGVNAFLSPGSDSELRLDSGKTRVVPGLLGVRRLGNRVQMDWSRVEVQGWKPFQRGAAAGWVFPVLVRWNVNPVIEKLDFEMCRLASFPSIVALLGLEHYLWLAGMTA